MLRDAKAVIYEFVCEVNTAGGKLPDAAIAGPSRLPSDRPLEGRGRVLAGIGLTATELSPVGEATRSYATTSVDRSRKRSTSSGKS